MNLNNLFSPKNNGKNKNAFDNCVFNSAVNGPVREPVQKKSTAKNKSFNPDVQKPCWPFVSGNVTLKTTSGTGNGSQFWTEQRNPYDV